MRQGTTRDRAVARAPVRFQGRRIGICSTPTGISRASRNSRQSPAVVGKEVGIRPAIMKILHPSLQRSCGLIPERHASALPPLPMQVDYRRGLQNGAADTEIYGFGNPCASIVEERKQRPVTLTGPGFGIWRVDSRFHLGSGQPSILPVETFHRSGQRRYRRIPSGTPRRCTCCSPASI